MCLNVASESMVLDDIELEIVEEQKYLGTLIAMLNRESDLQMRIRDCKGVVNETVEILNNEYISSMRMKYVETLLNSCLMQKFTHGCEPWDEMKKVQK